MNRRTLPSEVKPLTIANILLDLAAGNSRYMPRRPDRSRPERRSMIIDLDAEVSPGRHFAVKTDDHGR
jgi:hypothetical protein